MNYEYVVLTFGTLFRFMTTRHRRYLLDIRYWRGRSLPLLQYAPISEYWRPISSLSEVLLTAHGRPLRPQGGFPHWKIEGNRLKKAIPIANRHARGIPPLTVPRSDRDSILKMAKGVLIVRQGHAILERPTYTQCQGLSLTVFQ